MYIHSLVSVCLSSLNFIDAYHMRRRWMFQLMTTPKEWCSTTILRAGLLGCSRGTSLARWTQLGRYAVCSQHRDVVLSQTTITVVNIGYLEFVACSDKRDHLGFFIHVEF